MSLSGALHNLAVNDEEAQEAVATAGAIPPLISLMQNASPDLQAKAAATIWSIAGREENRKRIMEAGGIPPLVRMVQVHTHTHTHGRHTHTLQTRTHLAHTHAPCTHTQCTHTRHARLRAHTTLHTPRCVQDRHKVIRDIRPYML